MEEGIEPLNLTKGALAGLEYINSKAVGLKDVEILLNELWQSGDNEFKFDLIKLIKKVFHLSTVTNDLQN